VSFYIGNGRRYFISAARPSALIDEHPHGLIEFPDALLARTELEFCPECYLEESLRDFAIGET